MSSHLAKKVSEDEVGLRLDKFISGFEGVASRSRAARMIDENLVKVNGKLERSSYLLEIDDLVELTMPQARSVGIAKYDFKLDIVHEDPDVLVVNKPAGLVVHPAAGHNEDTLVNALVAHTKDLSMGFGEDRPGIVHRLDKETSGLLVIAKNDRAHRSLVEQFQNRSIHRLYQAVALGEMSSSGGTIQSYLARHPVDRKKFASILGEDRKIRRTEEPVPEIGKWAITDYRRLAKGHGLSFLELKLRTGRTHQIRVHLSEMGYPLAGDHVYGAEKKAKTLASVNIRAQVLGLERFLLHARELGFTHPVTGERLQFSQEWPEHDLARLKQWKFAP